MRKEQRRRAILNAARQVFASKGYHEAKVEDIAAAAKVAKGTVYLYFADKRSMFSELVDALFAKLSAAILRVDTEGDVAAQVKHNIRAVIGVLVDDPLTMRLLFDQASGVDPAFRTKTSSFYGGLKKLLVSSLSDGQKRGLVRKGDTKLYASFTIGALKEIMADVGGRPATKRKREQIVDALYDVLHGGYLRVAPDGPPAKKRRGEPGP